MKRVCIVSVGPNLYHAHPQGQKGRPRLIAAQDIRAAAKEYWRRVREAEANKKGKP